MLRGLGEIVSGASRVVIELAVAMGGTRLFLATGRAFIVAWFAFLLKAPLLFRITFFIGIFILAFIAASHLLR
jgi:hypothetical protein